MKGSKSQKRFKQRAARYRTQARELRARADAAERKAMQLDAGAARAQDEEE